MASVLRYGIKVDISSGANPIVVFTSLGPTGPQRSWALRVRKPIYMLGDTLRRFENGAGILVGEGRKLTM